MRLFLLTGYSAVFTAGPPLGGTRCRTPMASCPDAERASLLFRFYNSRAIPLFSQQALRWAALDAGRPWRHVLTPKGRHSFFVMMVLMQCHDSFKALRLNEKLVSIYKLHLTEDNFLNLHFLNIFGAQALPNDKLDRRGIEYVTS